MPLQPVPHLPSIERWRKDGSKGDYDVNTTATGRKCDHLPVVDATQSTISRVKANSSPIPGTMA
jgi:hypothetical protein